MPSRFCGSCGTPIEEGARFCPSCGKPADAPPPAPPPPQASYTPPPAQTNQYYAPPPPPAPVYQAPPSYSAAPVPQNYGADTSPMTVGQYIVTFIVLAIPLVGFIMMLVWAFGSNVNVNKKNLCKAALIMALIVIALYIVLGVVLGGIFATLFNSGMFNGY